MKYRFEAVSLSGRVFRAFTGVALLTAMMSQAVEAIGYGSGDGLGGDENSVTRQEVDLEEESEYESLGVVIGGLLLATVGVGFYEQQKKRRRASVAKPLRTSQQPRVSHANNPQSKEQVELEKRINDDEWELQMRLKQTEGRLYRSNRRLSSGSIVQSSTNTVATGTPSAYAAGYRNGVQDTTYEALLAASKVAGEIGGHGYRAKSDVVDGEATFID